MKKLQFLLILLVVGALFVPAVSATEIINESLIDFKDTSKVGTIPSGSVDSRAILTGFYAIDVAQFDDISYFTLEVAGTQGYWPYGELIPEGRHVTSYTYNGETKPAVIYVSRNKNLFGSIISTRYIFFPQNWDRQNLVGGQSINTPLNLVNARGSSYDDRYIARTSIYTPETNLLLCNENGIGHGLQFLSGGFTGRISHATVIKWENNLRVTTDDEFNGYIVELIRTINGLVGSSTIEIYKNDSKVYTDNTVENLMLWYPQNDINKINITSPIRTHSFDLNLEIPADPDDPGDPSRTGTITMTDHNGTTISGFEVTAVNHYTGEEYTVSTDTDVAVITLPMDRRTEIRNPQTGVYEEVPIGYYTFYGQKPGYKMLYEDGIRVSVVPEKYGSYNLCDILVRSESGPLTGKHQFQIQSRADFSILQTGTISAKSRTTGIWYNTTVTNGIATLILPYDTSDAISEYAGQYYVYATSPGYEDSDYGTQISVYPRTVSEIRTILLTPIGGVPTPGNVTLRIHAISETGPGVPNAEIFIAGVYGAGKDIWDTYTASSTGYLTVSVPGNSTYDIVARGAGYYDSSRRIEVFTEDPPIIEMRLYLSGAPTIEPTTEPTGWVTGPPTTQPTSGIPDEDDGSGGFLMEAVRGIGNAFGVGFATAKIILGMLLALAIGFATAKQLRGGAAEFGLGMLGGTMLGILVGLIPVWTIVVLLLVVGLYIGNRYVGGGNNG